MRRKYDQAMGPKGSMRRRTRSLLLLAAGVVVMIFYVAGASGTLSGSSFSAENGSLDPTAPATHDWNKPVEPISCPAVAPGSGTNCGLDLVKSSSDNALGQGSKEDATTVQIVNGSIPPSKDDLSRFYLNHEKVGSTDFLYLAWERSNLLGSAHLDFELNKNPVGLTASTPPGTITLNRTDGDKLIDFDFGGSGVPVLDIRTWKTTGTNATADCEASNTYPCWSKGTVLPAGVAESSVNCSPVQDNNPPNAPFMLAGDSKNGCSSTFGEAAINLEAAGIFSGGTCTSFADAWVKSRSSGNSFGSELKDFIAPIPTTISNCGTIIIKKVTVPSPDATNTSFSFTPAGAIGTTGFNLHNGEMQTYTGVQAGSSSSVNETVPAGWTLTSATCDNGNDPKTSITVTVNGTTTCTFTNTAKAKIIVKKVTVPSPSTQSFSFTASYNASGFSLQDGGSNDSGFLAPGSGYSVAETPVTGWDLTSSTCDNGNSPSSINLNPGDVVTCTFTNTQRGTIVIKKVTVPSPDPTGSTFTFTPGGQIGTTSFGLQNGGSKTYLNIKPGAANASSVAETVPAQFNLTSKTCDNGDPVTAITVAPGGTTTCTFTNTLKFGALKITKQSIKSGNAGLAGATFAVSGPNNYSTTLTSGADGTVCVDGLLSGSYSVQETAAPPGYTLDNPVPVSVTVDPNGAKCTDNPYVGNSTTFTDTPKTNLLVKVTSQDSGPGGSSSTITCTADATSGSIGNSPQTGGPANPVEVDANGLSPGDYTCKVHIDP